MTDKELLERAAKAAGYAIHGWINDKLILNFGHGERGEWHPLTDDGDETRLEAALGLNVTWFVEYVRIECPSFFIFEHYADHNGDKQAARRRAGVRAAAEMSNDD